MAWYPPAMQISNKVRKTSFNLTADENGKRLCSTNFISGTVEQVVIFPIELKQGATIKLSEVGMPTKTDGSKVAYCATYTAASATPEPSQATLGTTCVADELLVELDGADSTDSVIVIIYVVTS